MTTKTVERNLKIFMALVSVIFLVLIVRLGQLQLLHTQQFKTMSEENYIKPVTIPAPRGEIRDRNGQVMVKERPVYSVSYVYLGKDEQQEEKVAARLAGILNMKKEEILAAINDKKVRKFEPVKIIKDAPLQVVTKIAENRQDLPGVEVNIEPMRQYVNGDFAPHVLGYVREIKPEQLEKHREDGYGMGDRFGQAGLENAYEKYLRGVDGYQQVEVDRNQHPVKAPITIKRPTPGNNLILNIDARVQKAAEQAIDKMLVKLQNGEGQDKKYPNARAGAVVLLDIKTGKVLAMASKPGYDPNIFNGKLTKPQFDALFNPNNPFPAFNNRAMMAYAPGSTFKMITATAVLETKKVTPSQTIRDPGSVYLFGRSYKCWKPSGHGTVDLIKAIQVSCNVYFYQMGVKAGVNNLAKYAWEYGLGKLTGIDLPDSEEQTGRVPNPEWKKTFANNEKRFNERWDKKVAKLEEKYEKLLAAAETERDRKSLLRQKERDLRDLQGQRRVAYKWEVEWRDYETVIMAIGQGDSLYTPLQMARYIATIANGGKLFKPYLVDRVVDYKGNLVQQFQPELTANASISPETLAVIRRGMRAVTEPGGTAAGVFRGFPVNVAGKTGTAQTGVDKNKNPRDNHGWFVGFAPYENPQVAVAAVMEYAGHGGSSAGVVARDVLAAYFNIDQSKDTGSVTSDE
ncbi:MAG: penicillin-binding protein 2 [Bacillota bacterium]